ncbi:MAG: sulfotransferase family protein [Cyanobacteria bacterium RM1_2_2]|nr:sulfotransferase family protein [Cyanobacteria bacterium RM1_2_2]
MLINHQHKFIFIHVYKVAGTSVLNALENQTYPAYVPSAIRPGLTKVLRKFHLSPSFPMHIHVKAKEVKAKLDPKIYDNYFKFAFVRNPWDWQVSLYEYAKQTKTHPQYDLMRSFSDFDQYLEWRVTQERTLQKEFVTDESGNLIVDYVGRFERLGEDFSIIADKVGMNVALPAFNKTRARKPYTDYYTERTKQMIYDHFREDIESFGYQFG